jgi:hypothetical protein
MRLAHYAKEATHCFYELKHDDFEKNVTAYNDKIRHFAPNANFWIISPLQESHLSDNRQNPFF